VLVVARATVTEEQISGPLAPGAGAVGGQVSRFIVEPLEPGFGYTVGNAMRRTMLSSVPGSAISSLKIDGVLHEFTTIPGVKEDVTELVLNVKDLVIRMETEESTGMLHLRARGPKDVTAADIEAPAGIEIVNPDLHIATLNAKGRLDLELTVERGRGYQVADRMKRKDVIGVIPVDAIFTPVRRVTYVVEHTRVEQMTNYDRLILEVETNGAVTPKEAVVHGARRLGDLIGLFNELVEGPMIGEETAEAATAGPRVDNEKPIEQLELSVRALNCLKREGIHTLGDLLECTREDLMDIRNFGEKSVVEVVDKLSEMGLNLRNKDL
jgi:DNA-directed RNA polymerase subunit alpha